MSSCAVIVCICATLLYFMQASTSKLYFMQAQNWSRSLRRSDNDELSILQVKSIAFTNNSGSTEYGHHDNDIEENIEENESLFVRTD